MQEFFRHYLPERNICFVVIQRMVAEQTGILCSLLEKNTTLPVVTIQHRMKAEAGCIYVAPGETGVTLEEGRFLLEDAATVPGFPIDRFFSSLGDAHGECSVGIVLSGAGSDGLIGARTIKEKGGMVMVQQPATAKFDTMPVSLIATGLADYILPPKLMGDTLCRYIDHLEMFKQPECDVELSNETSLLHILDEIKKVSKLDFTHYKPPTLQRRITRRMALKKAKTLAEYQTIIKDDKTELELLWKDFLIGVTRFFRDGYVFDELNRLVIPAVAQNKGYNEVVKCWVIGCSTGEEAYTLAILLSEYRRLNAAFFQVKIFATDADPESLERAARGIYPLSIEGDVRRELLEQYFTREGDHYRVSPDLRKMVIFSRHDILHDPPFLKMDIVTCRNLLIYFKSDLQRKIFTRIHFALNKNGYLLIGPNETIHYPEAVFEEVSKPARIYRNAMGARNLEMDALLVTEYSGIHYNKVHQTPPLQKVVKEQRMAQALNNVLLDQFKMACVFIDKDFRIINAQGNYDGIISLPSKQFSLNLCRMVNEDLSLAISTAVRKAGKEKIKVAYQGIQAGSGKTKRQFNLWVAPVQLSGADEPEIFMVLFEEQRMSKAPPKEPVTERYDIADNVYQRIRDLERELATNRENLQSTIEELESSNEELQSSNEEILAANEELQSTNEELQSVNEELYTINTDYQSKINELAQLNDDITNLLKSTDIGTLFVDLDLRIRRFTPALIPVFNLISGDVGRPVTHVSHNLRSSIDFSKVLQNVVQNLKPFEAEVQLHSGQWFLMRVMPYVTQNKIIQGGVITFVNMDELKKTSERLVFSEDKWNSLVENTPDVIVIISHDYRVLYMNQVTPEAANLGYAISDFIGKNYLNMFAEEERKHILHLLQNIAETGKADKIEITEKLTGRNYEMTYVALKTDNLPQGFIGISNDITDRKRSERWLLESENRFRKLASCAPVMIWMLDKDLNMTWMNEQWQDFSGKPFEALEGQQWMNYVHPDDRKYVHEAVEKSYIRLQGGDAEFRIMGADGHYHWVKSRGILRTDEKDEFDGFICCSIDIDDHIKLEKRKDEFFSIASHELKTPLTSIQAYAELMTDELTDQEKKKYGIYLAKMNKNIETLNQFVVDLLDVSRIQSGQLTLNLKTVPVNELIEDCVTLIQSTTRHTIKLKTITPVSLLCDSKRIEQVIVNFLTNAVKYSPNDKPIEVNLLDEGTHARVEVIDQGIGISRIDQKKIFDRYFRVDENYSTGLGIGLFISAEIIARHGGDIGVKSVLGKGSTFYFTIPMRHK